MEISDTGKDGVLCCDGGRDDPDLHDREERPQGLLYFTKFDSVPILVDALFDAPTSREFTQSELATKADVSSRSVSNRLGILLNLGIIRQVEDTDRFSLNLDSEITWRLRELDGLIKQAQAQEGYPAHEERSTEESHTDTSPVEDVGDDATRVMASVREQVTAQYAD